MHKRIQTHSSTRHQTDIATGRSGMACRPISRHKYRSHNQICPNYQHPAPSHGIFDVTVEHHTPAEKELSASGQNCRCQGSDLSSNYRIGLCLDLTRDGHGPVRNLGFPRDHTQARAGEKAGWLPGIWDKLGEGESCGYVGRI